MTVAVELAFMSRNPRSIKVDFPTLIGTENDVVFDEEFVKFAIAAVIVVATNVVNVVVVVDSFIKYDEVVVVEGISVDVVVAVVADVLKFEGAVVVVVVPIGTSHENDE